MLTNATLKCAPSIVLSESETLQFVLNSYFFKLKDAAWKESYEKLSVLKSRDITLPRRVPIVKAMVFPVVVYGCESWTIKKAERQKIDD